MAVWRTVKLCSHFMPHADSLAVMQVMDEVRRGGLQYSQQLEAI
jgi:hypothetical protein